MPFTLIKGRFKPQARTLTGDSVPFLADDPGLWARLEGNPVSLGTGAEDLNTVLLRLEGIDALEAEAIEPLSTLAKDNLVELISYDEEAEPEPSGYILARMTDDLYGRPISFAFSGSTTDADGSSIYLDTAMLRSSVNYKQIESGFAYPLYYNTLFSSLRNAMDKALDFAQQNQLGYWPYDRTTSGVQINSRNDIATLPPIWPKLWRRLREFLRDADSLDGFREFLEQINERVDVLPIMEECGLQDIVEVRGNEVRLNELPENLRVVGQAGRRTRRPNRTLNAAP